MTNFTHAIVTGGSSGIGKATARLLARRGSRITILARRAEILTAATSELMLECPGSGKNVAAFQVDVSDREAVNSAIARAERSLGPCDLLVTCAGVVQPGYFEDQEAEIFEQTMAINYFGTLYAIQAVLGGMKERRKGRIVMVSSGAGIVGVFGYSSYSPTKFALRGLAEVLRAELARHGIGVSIVYPPDTDTPQLAEENLTKPAETKAITSGAKTWRPEDVAGVILDGLDSGRFAITPGWEMTWLHRIHSAARPLLAWHFDRMAAKAGR